MVQNNIPERRSTRIRNMLSDTQQQRRRSSSSPSRPQQFIKPNQTPTLKRVRSITQTADVYSQPTKRTVNKPELLDLVPPFIIFELAKLTAVLLDDSQDELRTVKWSDSEANTDTGFSVLASMLCEKAWNDNKYTMFKDFKHLHISATKPDVLITFTDNNTGMKSKIYKIELKSSKKGGPMPGSTVQSLDINEPLIFCVRPSDKAKIQAGYRFHIRVGQYHDALNKIVCDTELFQDRTPRPKISFDNMKELGRTGGFVIKDKVDWLKHYADCAYNRTLAKSKSMIHKSWQDKLTQFIIDRYIESTSEDEFAKTKLKNKLSRNR